MGFVHFEKEAAETTVTFDKNNPTAVLIYSILSVLDERENDKVLELLTLRQCQMMAVCPECKLDLFVHFEGCSVASFIDEVKQARPKGMTFVI